MSDTAWKTKKRKVKLAPQETTNRDGHWTRRFSVRTEPFPILEHWASENGFRLAAVKGKRRLYRKGRNPALYTVFLDFRVQGENEVIVSVWIQVGLSMRALWFFQIGNVMNLEPSGWPGIRFRRQICAEVNSLLTRMDQATIFGSDSFHIADTDVSTLLLTGLFTFPTAVFVLATGKEFQFKPGLINELASLLGYPLLTLGATAMGLWAIHHFVSIRKLKAPLLKMISALAAALIYCSVTGVVLAKTSSEINAAKVTYYCVHHSENRACSNFLNSLSTRERSNVLERIHSIEKQLSVRER